MSRITGWLTGLVACLLVALPAWAADGPAVIRSAKSGNWSQAATWEGGQVPAAGARVLILSGHTVTYDVAKDDVIRAINISGTLAFARDRNTLLNTGLIKIEPTDKFSEEGFDCDHVSVDLDPSRPRATLEVGSQLEPIPAKYKAVIRLHGVAGLDPQSCPAIVCCAGRMDFHGAPLSRTWVKLGETAAKDGEGSGAGRAGHRLAGRRPASSCRRRNTDYQKGESDRSPHDHRHRRNQNHA